MRLLAVRHGQASFGSADYDRLSELGWQQGRRLGDWLAVHGERFERVICGGMRRHRETFDAIAEAFRDRDLPMPQAEFDDAFNEFDHRAVIESFCVQHPQHPAHVAWRAEPAAPRTVVALLQAAFACWADGSLVHGGESWATFRRRTRDAGTRLHARLHEGEVLLVSSGGVIAQLAAEALDAPDARAVELNLGLRNSALAEFHGRSDALRLGSWNALPHLADARELWTYY
jgi:broad specificity phosphatase PhoE